jgi:hypothetical protein
VRRARRRSKRRTTLGEKRENCLVIYFQKMLVSQPVCTWRPKVSTMMPEREAKASLPATSMVESRE